jgi:hypothetical protein
VKFPQNEIPPAPEVPVTGPVVTGHSDEVSTPTSFDPVRPLKTVINYHSFPNREADITQIT